MTRGETGKREGRRLRLALALVALLAFALSVARYAQDLRLRRAAERLAGAAGIERTRPEDVEAMALEPGGDLAAAMAVSAAIQGASAASPALPRGATDLMLEATAIRPGWAYHRYLLGLTDPEKPGQRSRRALRLAADGASGMDAFWSALGRMNLAAWSDLPPAERAEAAEVFRRCFRGEEFVSKEFSAVAAAVGRSRAIALLPEDAGVLGAAAGSAAESGDIPGAALLLSRGEKAEWRERAQDLDRLEHRRRLGDLEGLRAGCIAWFDRHPFRERDDAEGREQLARLLALWPDDRFGSWSRDRRAHLVRFFLDGRASDIPAETLARTIESLTGVPDPIRARVSLLAGNLAAAQALARGAGSIVPLEWNAYFLELARRELRRGRLSEARAALAKLSLGAREGCEALLVRREIARALQDPEELSAVEERLAPLREPSPQDWASRGTLSLCVDPAKSAGGTLEVEVGSGSPAILAWGWDGGRFATHSFSSEEGSFRVPLAGLSGQRSLWASFLMGASGRSLHASLKKAS